jgi:hypothetical protein
MRILVGTAAEIVEYERLSGLADRDLTPARSEDSAVEAFIRDRFMGPALDFALDYAPRATAETGVRPEIRRSTQTPDGRSKYLPMVEIGDTWTGTVVYVHRARVDFRLHHTDVADLPARVERKEVDDPDSAEFQVVLRRQTIDDVDLAVELTRRAVNRARGA